MVTTSTLALASSSASSSRSRSSRRATSTRFAPCSVAKLRAISRPRPEDAPVTRTQRERKCIGFTAPSLAFFGRRASARFRGAKLGGSALHVDLSGLGPARVQIEILDRAHALVLLLDELVEPGEGAE